MLLRVHSNLNPAAVEAAMEYHVGGFLRMPLPPFSGRQDVQPTENLFPIQNNRLVSAVAETPVGVLFACPSWKTPAAGVRPRVRL